MIDYSYMELIPASLIFRFALFSIKLTCVRVVQAFDQKQIFSKYYQEITPVLKIAPMGSCLYPTPPIFIHCVMFVLLSST